MVTDYSHKEDSERSNWKKNKKEYCENYTEPTENTSSMFFSTGKIY